MPFSLPERIAYFISGHGYGHAARSARLINALAPYARVRVYSTVEQAFFQRELVTDCNRVELELDCGCVQKGALEVDVAATYARYAAIEDSRQHRIEACCDQLLSQGAEFVIGDIPPLAFAAAARMGLPSLAVSNFTWAEIYAEYVSEEPRFASLLAAIRRDYAQADHYARLYPALVEHPFRRCTDVGLLCHNQARNKRWLAERLGLNVERKWCLIYIGAFGVDGVDWQRLGHFDDWQFMGLYRLPHAPANYRQIALSGGIEHADITANCDLVLGKLGYGLVSECLYWGRPIAFPRRRRFAEHAALEDAVFRHGIGYALSPEDFRACRLQQVFSWAATVRAKQPVERLAAEEILGLIADTWIGGSSHCA